MAEKGDMLSAGRAELAMQIGIDISMGAAWNISIHWLASSRVGRNMVYI